MVGRAQTVVNLNSTVTQQIAAFETHIGQKLFSRKSKGESTPESISNLLPL